MTYTPISWTINSPTPQLLNHIDIRFGDVVQVRLTIQSANPLPAAAWSTIGFSAAEVERLAKQLDELMTPPPPDNDPDDAA